MLRRLLAHVLCSGRLPDRRLRREDGRDRRRAVLHQRLTIRSLEAHRYRHRRRTRPRRHVLPRQRPREALPRPFGNVRDPGGREGLSLLEQAASVGIVIARSDAAIQSRRAPYVPLDCFAIARPEGRASLDALWLAVTIAGRPKCNLS